MLPWGQQFMLTSCPLHVYSQNPWKPGPYLDLILTFLPLQDTSIWFVEPPYRFLLHQLYTFRSSTHNELHISTLQFNRARRLLCPPGSLSLEPLMFHFSCPFLTSPTLSFRVWIILRTFPNFLFNFFEMSFPLHLFLRLVYFEFQGLVFSFWLICYFFIMMAFLNAWACFSYCAQN